MDQLLSSFKIAIPEGAFIKDPETSVLGKKIITQGMDLIYDMGFDGFTFKKLGIHIGSNESSIYRYFENKHKFLLYLSSWYWSWIEYKLVTAIYQNDSQIYMDNHGFRTEFFSERDEQVKCQVPQIVIDSLVTLSLQEYFKRME